MKNKLSLIFLASMVMPTFMMAERYFKVEKPTNTKRCKDREYEKKFFIAWLTGDYYATKWPTWHNGREQLEAIPAFIEALQKADDNDIICIKAEGIGPKSHFHNSLYEAKEDALSEMSTKERRRLSTSDSDAISFSPSKNLLCYNHNHQGDSNFYTCTLTLTAEKAKTLAQSAIVKGIIEAKKEYNPTQPWAQALNDFIEKNK